MKNSQIIEALAQNLARRLFQSSNSKLLTITRLDVYSRRSQILELPNSRGREYPIIVITTLIIAYEKWAHITHSLHEQ